MADSSMTNEYYEEEWKTFEVLLQLSGSKVVWEKKRGVQYVGMSCFEGLKPSKGEYIAANFDRFVSLGWTPTQLEKLIYTRDRSKDFSNRRSSKIKMETELAGSVESVQENEEKSEAMSDSETEYEEDNLEYYVSRAIKYENLKRFENQLKNPEKDFGQVVGSKVLAQSYEQLIKVLGKRFRARLPNLDTEQKLNKRSAVKNTDISMFLSGIDQEILLIGFLLHGAELIGSSKKNIETVPLSFKDIPRLDHGFRLKLSASCLRSLFGIEYTASVLWLHKHVSKMKERLKQFIGEHFAYEHEATRRAIGITFQAMIDGKLEDLKVINDLQIVALSFYEGEFVVCISDEGIQIEDGKIVVLRKGVHGWRKSNID